MLLDLNIQYAVRLLSVQNSEETKMLFYGLFDSDRSEGVKHDIILALARWNDWHWLSDVKNRFRMLSDVGRRSFVIASYSLADEGAHWRQHVRRELNDFQQLISR